MLVLGDQLDPHSAALADFAPERDAILQMEVAEEATYIRQHRRRLTLFFSAMRHFRDARRAQGWRTYYSELEDPDNQGTLAAEARRWIGQLAPERVIVLEPGDFRVREALRRAIPGLVLRADRHFLCERATFEEFAGGHPRPVLEGFYRFMRRRLGVLLEADGRPRGGAWNFDARNRRSFGRAGPGRVPQAPRFVPDAVTRDVLRMVQRRFPDHPGRLEDFDLPVTREQAQRALEDFVAHRLPGFGPHQDAMWGGEPFLWHSRLSSALNLHLLDPRAVLDAALAREAAVPLSSLEGFVRQLIGWREFVRALYWQHMPGFAQLNALDAQLPVPAFYWTGVTEMHCLAEAVRHTLDHAYAHHIERLMVLGLFCLLLGVHPYEVHRWHMALFIDAIDWVSLPNVMGMSQYADGGRLATKPYAASGRYIERMSNYCRDCRYDPGQASGASACPFTTLYWDFLARHEPRLAGNARMAYPYASLRRREPGELKRIRARADALRASLA